MKVEIEEVYYIARLARLHLSEGEASTVSDKLSKILDYMTKLDSIEDEDEVVGESASKVENVVRPDQLFQRISHEEALSQSPDPDNNYFRAPKVIG
jgi:aspartyl-tRNA(Asn)/glutamyl-tRNA(Gln) amidotransferase subunit C